MEPSDRPDCKRLIENARQAIQSHIRAQGNWQIASLRREEAVTLDGLRALQDAAASRRKQAVSAYRAHLETHES
jgi:hypothetical protein